MHGRRLQVHVGGVDSLRHPLRRREFRHEQLRGLRLLQLCLQVRGGHDLPVGDMRVPRRPDLVQWDLHGHDERQEQLQNVRHRLPGGNHVQSGHMQLHRQWIDALRGRVRERGDEQPTGRQRLRRLWGRIQLQWRHDLPGVELRVSVP